jgi:hypothetical protein
MKKQNGSSTIALIVILCIIAVIVGVCSVSFVVNYNYGNRAEKEITAAWENNENILATYSQKIMELAQIPAMYKDDVLDVYTKSITARYGEDGSDAMMQWIKEQNPNLDSGIYKTIQTEMIVGRNKFESAQTKLVDLKRGYETNLGYLWKGFWLTVAGYPKINLDDYDIISSGHAQDVFESGVDNGIQINR